MIVAHHKMDQEGPAHITMTKEDYKLTCQYAKYVGSSCNRAADNHFEHNRNIFSITGIFFEPLSSAAQHNRQILEYNQFTLISPNHQAHKSNLDTPHLNIKLNTQNITPHQPYPPQSPQVFLLPLDNKQVGHSHMPTGR